MNTDSRMHQIELKAELSALEELVIFLEKGCADLGVPLGVQRALELSADEAVTNVINYAYPDDVPGLMRLTLELVDGEVVLTIEDQGQPFDEAEVPEPDLDASIEDRHIGGLGVFLMHKMMDRVERSRRGDTNHLLLAKKF
jgi:serine/threonine-protein kinase RsbW